VTTAPSSTPDNSSVNTAPETAAEPNAAPSMSKSSASRRPSAAATPALKVNRNVVGPPRRGSTVVGPPKIVTGRSNAPRLPWTLRDATDSSVGPSALS
jgi:hypothetical protein